MAKLLAAEASWEAANACLQLHGGFGFATEYRVYQVAPISTPILFYIAEHILGCRDRFETRSRAREMISSECGDE
jgi:acyl-CoA dehydrogenase